MKSTWKTRCGVGLVLVLLSGTILAASLAAWWSLRENHLFGTGRWIAGKDTGKFVFYTYSFLFDPLEKGRIDLASHMGYQEIRYRHSETTNRRLKNLAFDTAISADCYLWITLHASADGRLRLRLSNSARHRNGFYRYDGEGRLAEYSPFDQVPVPSESWRRMQVHREDNRWVTSLDDTVLGSVLVPESTEGWFGFQGSGRACTHVYLRNIDLSLQRADGSTEIVRERFKQGRVSRKGFQGLLLAGLIAGILRMGRACLLADLLGVKARATWVVRDHLAFTITLLAAWQLFSSPQGGHIAGAFAVAELWTFLLLVATRRDGDTGSQPLKPGLLWLGMIGALLVPAGMKHGEWLGRAQRHIWSQMAPIDPMAFTLLPAGETSLETFTSTDLRELQPGEPFFPPDTVFREQEISFTCRFHEPATLDVVFQQQAYQTRGDPGGEPLPLQRRLVRLSTCPGVTSGLAEGIHKQPAPFYALPGLVKLGEPNLVRISSYSDRIKIELNGETVSFPRAQALGYGETGFMAYEPGIEIEAIRIRPLSGGKPGWERRAAGSLLVLFLVPAAGVFLLFLCGFPRRPAVLLHGIPLLYVPAVFAGLSLLLPSSTLAFLGTTRILWLDIAGIGCLVALAPALLQPGSLLPRKALLFNVLFLLLFVSAGQTWYDQLAPEHPWRHTRGVAIPAPATANTGSLFIPWYARNQSVGANNFVWHQRFGPRVLSRAKPRGQLRIFTMGGSQAWGSGAEDSFHTYDALLERALHARGYPETVVINAGVNGAGVAIVRDLYHQLIRRYAPDVLVLDIGLNDSASLNRDRDPEVRNRHRGRLVRALESVLKSCREDQVSVVLVLEPMSGESSLRQDRALYAAYAETAQRYGFTVIKASEETLRLEEDHAVWWDTAHLAPYGQNILADLLLEPVMAVLPHGDAQ
ncbi:MAG: SGNH/GDSL hydrolase family protein [Verrucomicrobiota bacterium]